MKKVVALLMVLVVMGSLAVATAVNEKDEELKLPDELTEEDLQRLYRKYNITENDVRFAKGELPHYLKGTMMDGKVVTMGKITKEGKVENWVDPLFYNWCIKKWLQTHTSQKST
jgi:hypothetical protein